MNFGGIVRNNRFSKPFFDFETEWSGLNGDTKRAMRIFKFRRIVKMLKDRTFEGGAR
jgi:hypothetical protein